MDKKLDPQLRLERALDAMSETGWPFGEIIQDIMRRQGLTSPADATDEQWATFLEEWCPK